MYDICTNTHTHSQSHIHAVTHTRTHTHTQEATGVANPSDGSFGSTLAPTTTLAADDPSLIPVCGRVVANAGVMTLRCSTVIASIEFASYGLPSGICGNYHAGFIY